MIVSLADMKTYLNISGGAEDAFLTTQLNIIQSAIEIYCRRKFDRATYVQTFYNDDYDYSKELTLYQFPLVSVASVLEDTVAKTGYRIHKPSGILIHAEDGFFKAKETVVTYDAGYDYADMPIALQSTVYSLVEERYNKKQAGVSLNFGSDVQRVSIPGTISIDFDYSLTNNDRSTNMGTILGNQLNVLGNFRSERTIIGGGKLVYVA